jgi:hypothetical protein
MPPASPSASFWHRALTSRERWLLAAASVVLMAAVSRAILGRWDHAGLLVGAMTVFVGVRIVAQRVHRTRRWNVPRWMSTLALVALGACVGVLAALLSRGAVTPRLGLWFGSWWGATSALNDALLRWNNRPAVQDIATADRRST